MRHELPDNFLCSISDCGNTVVRRGWCSKHYQRWLKYRDPHGGGRKYETPKEAFAANVDKNGAGGCWIWGASKDKCGYGRIWINGKLMNAHRFSWEQINGPIPDGLQVLHRCDNPPCVNPNHLFLGTPADNAADRDAKGRGNQPKGEAHGRSKLTEARVPAIRADKRPQSIIAANYGVSQATVSAIKLRKLWKHVPETAGV